MEKYKIGIIVPYFGKLPNYFNLWLKSCEYNYDIDWIIITDDKTEYEYPQNVKVYYTTFKEIKIKFQENFDFEINLDKPYKLCDFKPAYGDLFKNELKQYDFWGHCDLDIVWGDLRKYITDSILETNERLFLNGHLILYKNTDEVNTWYKTLDPVNGVSYMDVFSNADSYCFDEDGGKTKWGGMNKMVEQAKKSNYNEEFFDDIRFDFNTFCSMRTIKEMELSPKSAAKLCSAYSFEEGKLFKHILLNEHIIKSESMYVHFQKRKMDINLDINRIDKFLMVPNKFIEYREIDEEFLRKNSIYKKIYMPYILLRFKNLKRKLTKLVNSLIRR